MADEAAGHAPTGQYFDYFPPCNANSLLIVATIWCDTTQIYDGGPCNNMMGGWKFVTSLDGSSCR